MTREEAIKMLKSKMDGHTDTSYEWAETVRMAIQALEKENIYDDREHYITISRALYDKLIVTYDKALEQEPCEDAVSRDMALEKMADYAASGYADSAEDFEEYSRIICQLPSVTQKSETVTEFADRCRECGAKYGKLLKQAQKTEQWQELKETITELRDNDGTATQQEVCKFLVNLMDVLEKQMQEPQESEEEDG